MKYYQIKKHYFNIKEKSKPINIPLKKNNHIIKISNMPTIEFITFNDEKEDLFFQIDDL